MGMDQYLLIPFLMGWTSIYQLFWCSPGVQGFDTLPYLNLTLHSYGGDIFVAGWERWDCSLSSLPRASHTKLRIWKSVQDRKLSWTWIPQNKDSSPTVSMSNPQHFDTKDPMIQCSRQNTSMSINSRCVRALCCFVSQGRMHFPVTSYCFHTTQWHISFLDIFWISFGLFHVFLWHTMAVFIVFNLGYLRWARHGWSKKLWWPSRAVQLQDASEISCDLWFVYGISVTYSYRMNIYEQI